MFRLYWPYKKVPTWLQKITFTDEQGNVVNDKRCKAHHMGFGIIIRKKSGFVCYGKGTFIYINGFSKYRCHVSIVGQGGGVFYTSYWRMFWRQLTNKVNP